MIFVDPDGLRKTRAEDICNGTDCVDPAYDPSSNGPTPSPGKLPKDPVSPEKGKGNCPEYMKKLYGGCSCADISSSLGACISCCSTIGGQMRSGGSAGGICGEQCYRKAGITSLPPPAMCFSQM